jgi:hypothetical protein
MRTICASEKTYFEKLNWYVSEQTSDMELSEGLKIVCREGLNVSVVKIESASGIWNFLDVKANAFPRSFVSKRLSHQLIIVALHYQRSTI